MKTAEAVSNFAKEKDVDGFHPLNVAALWQKQECVLPCTPKGIIKMLKAAGVEIKGKGTLGLITYMRTDSLRITPEAAVNARKIIEEKFGKEYVAHYNKFSKKNMEM